MTKCVINLIVLCGLVVLSGCSSTPRLQQPTVLNTKSVTNQYYYCESCPKPTKLVRDTYVPLEPDEPVVQSIPIIQPVKKEIKKHKKKHRVVKKKKAVKKPQPQCILWK